MSLIKLKKMARILPVPMPKRETIEITTNEKKIASVRSSLLSATLDESLIETVYQDKSNEPRQLMEKPKTTGVDCSYSSCSRCQSFFLGLLSAHTILSEIAINKEPMPLESHRILRLITELRLQHCEWNDKYWNLIDKGKIPYPMTPQVKLEDEATFSSAVNDKKLARFSRLATLDSVESPESVQKDQCKSVPKRSLAKRRRTSPKKQRKKQRKFSDLTEFIMNWDDDKTTDSSPYKG